jgi:hypothetical protein
VTVNPDRGIAPAPLHANKYGCTLHRHLLQNATAVFNHTGPNSCQFKVFHTFSKCYKVHKNKMFAASAGIGMWKTMAFRYSAQPGHTHTHNCAGPTETNPV